MATNEPQQEPQSQELWEIYKQNDFVDAKDNQGDWRVGYIVEKNLHTKLFKVRFDGWSAKYDEYYRFSSAKLIDFRGMVIGYTGQKKNPGIRPDWKFTLSDHLVRLKDLQEFLASPNKTAHQINQIIRGHNYFYTDFLMTKTYDSSESMSAVMEYFKVSIKFAVEYLKAIDPEFTQYYRSHQIVEEFHTVNPDSAMANAFYEILDTLYIICGGYPRLNGFFAENAALLKKYLNIDFEKNVKKYYQMHIFQQFLGLGGFDIVEELIKTKLAHSKAVIPFLFLKSLCSLYYSLGNQISYNEKAPWLRSLVEIARANIAKLTDRDIKDLNKAHVTELLETIQLMFKNSPQEKEIDEWALETEIEFCHKMIMCPFFEKKLKGVVGLIEMVDRNKVHPNASELVRFVLKHKILESLFAFDNAEIIKKSVEFCRVLYYNDQFPPQMAYKIWQMRVGKHEAALQEIYSLISILPSRKLTETFSVDFFEEISKVPMEEWDQDYIKMVKEYSISAIGFVAIDDPIPHLFGFDILYRYTVVKKNQFSLNCLSQFLDRIEKTPSVETFVLQCFKKIAANDHSDIHTEILLKIINEQHYNFKDTNPQVSEFIVQDILANSDDPLDKIEKRLELLTEICRLVGIGVSFEEFISLWKQFKGKSGEKAFYNWTLKKKDGGKVQINSRVVSEIRKDILQTIWSSREEFSGMQEDEVEILIEFFKSSNIVEGNLKRTNIIIKTEQMEELIGLDTIWRAFETVGSDKAARELADLIAQIHMSPTKANENSREDWIRQLVDSFAKKLSLAYHEKSLDRVTRLMLLARKMIERDEEIFVTKPSKFYMMKDYTVVDKESKEEKTIRFNVSGYCYDFKKTVADKFKIPFKSFRLSCKGEYIRHENYFKTMTECAFHSAFELEPVEVEASLVKNALNSHLELFFELLGHRELERTVWEVISELPIPKEFQEKISSSEKPWEEISDESIYKELYMLRVMRLMDEDWWKAFTRGSGLEMLANKFSKMSARTKIEREYMKMVCESVVRCLSMPEQERRIKYDVLVLSSFESLLGLFEAMEGEKTENKSSSVEVQITALTFLISEKVSAHLNPLGLLLSSFSKLRELLCMGLVTVDNFYVRKEFAGKLLSLSDNFTTLDYLDLILKPIFQLANHYAHPEKTKQYFSYSSVLVGRCSPQMFKEYLETRNQNLLATVKQNLEAALPEKTIETLNYQLLGNLTLMKELVKYASVEFTQRVAEFVLYKCFFSHLQEGGGDFKCKTKDSRAQAFLLLKSIAEDGSNIESILSFLSAQHKNALWRSRKFDDWTLTPGDKIKSASGYVGLKNLGCTCYMNSFFQQIFMIPQFREAILQCEDPSYGHDADEENVLFQVKKMFFSLMHSERKFYTPAEFCHAFKNYEGQPTNVHEQMDIDEFSGILFDRLENQMKGTPSENLVKDFFGGVFSNEIICKGCPHFSETEESFLSVSLSVKNKKNIYQSLDTMIKGDTLEGDNAYFCERCNKKVTAVKRVCFKKLPDHLFLTLKRFEFDFETMNKMKINDFCEFPTELNLKEYSQQFLRKQENPDRFDEEESLPDSYYDYVLKGVAIHLGYADSGHYYSFIKERSEEGKWLEFNDTTVRSFDIRKLAEEAFGGEVGTFELKEKIKNAYMLIYERRSKSKDHSAVLDPRLDLLSQPVYSSLLQQIHTENVIQKMENILFSEEYTLFVTNLLKAAPRMPRESATTTLKYAVLVYLTVTIRQKEEAVSFQFLKKLQPVLVGFPEVYEWVLEVFSTQESLQEYFKNNPAREIKKLLAGWLVSLCRLSRPEVQQHFIDGLVFHLLKEQENVSEFCSILFELMKDEKLCDEIVSRRIPGILMDNIFRRDQPDKQKELQGLANSHFNSVQEIGKEIIIEKTAYELSKKPRPNNENPYIWGIICEAIKRCRALGQTLEEYLSLTKVEDLVLPSQKVYKILEEARGKFMIKKFATFLVFLVERDEAMSEEIMHLIYKGLREFESKRYRQFFILMKALLQIDDKYKEARNKRGLGFMIKALKDNQKYTLDSNIIQQWIMKLTRKNPTLQQVLRQEPTMLGYLTELSTRKIPTEDICRKNCYFLDSSVNKYHGIKMMKTRKGYIDLSKEIENFYLEIGAEQAPPDVAWDSDDDLTEVEVSPGDTISYFDQKELIDYIEVQVKEVLFGRLWVSIDNSKVVPVWKDDEKLTRNDYIYVEEEESEELICSENTTEMADEDLLVD